MSVELSNPYIVGNPIKTREMFFGREDDFLFVSRKVGEGRSNQIVVLCGERRSGKTSILFQIMGGRLGPSFIPILIDMQMLAGTRGDGEFFHAIIRAGYAALETSGIMDAGDGEPDGEGVEHLVEAFLARVVKKAPGRTVLFLLDEYELIESKIGDGSLSPSTILYLAGILESAFPASFIFTGSTNLEDRDPAIWKTLLGKSAYRKISYLSPRDTERLITEPLRGAVQFPAAVVRSMYRLTAGQPFYTQVVCQNITDLLIDEQRDDPSTDDLERVVRDIVASPLPQMIYTWNSFSPQTRILLSSLAGTLDGPGASADNRRILRHIASNRILLPFSRERANVLLEDAYHREFLEKDDTSAYRFRMDIFRRWIVREHSIWKVAKEANVEFGRALRGVAVPAAAAVVGAAALAAAWLFLVPATMPGLAVWAQSHRLLPPTASGETAGESPSGPVRWVSFTSNRGPFSISVDGVINQTSSESTLGLTWLLMSSIDSGVHDVIATLPGDPEAIWHKSVTIDQKNNSVLVQFQPPPVPRSRLDKYLSNANCDAERISQLKAALDAGHSVVVIESVPSGAKVKLGDEELPDVTPIALDLMPGFKLLWVVHEGYKYQPESFTPEPGIAYFLHVDLQPERAALVFEGRDVASVFLDDVLVATTPNAPIKPYFTGDYTLRIVNAGTGRTSEKKVSLAAGDVLRVNVDK